MYALLITVFIAVTPTAGPQFIEDDYAKAVLKAKREKKLLFVDAWAPWCHTCIFMRQHVLNRPGFRAFENRVVFAAIDTEQKRNEAFVAKFPVSSWPTLFFIDPTTETVATQFAGAVDEKMLQAMLESAQLPKGAATLSVADAEGSTLATLIERSKRSGVETLSMLLSLLKAKKYEACAQASLDTAFQSEIEQAAVASAGLSCALELTDTTAKARWVPAVLAKAQKAVMLPGAFADDVSSLYEQLVDEREAANDAEGAKKWAADWLTFLEANAKAASTPAARAVFDPHRVNAALALKAPERALAALQQSEKDFPLDYNPPARLALLYQQMGEVNWSVALGNIDRALSLCKEGPRKIRLFSTKADILSQMGRSTDAVKALLAAKTHFSQLPPAQRSPKLLAQLDSALALAQKK